jgi:hypothetical protein
MPAIDGAGGSSAAAQAAAAARARAAEAAKEKAEEAKKAAEEAQQAAQKAQEEAAKAKSAAGDANKDVNKLQNDLKSNPDKKAELEPKIGAAKDRATRLDNDATTAEQHAKTLTDHANDVANQALTKEKGANQAADAAGKKDQPFAEANKVKDVYDAKGQLSDAEQTKLFGNKLAVSPEDAGKVDAQRLAQTKDPATRAQMMSTYLKDGQDPSYQKAFLDAAKPQIQEMSKQIWDDKSGVSTDQRQKALDSLTQLSEKLGPDAQKQLADQFAQTLPNKGLGSDSNNLGGMLQKSIEDGKGVSFGANLIHSLQASGKTDAANDAAKYVNNGITTVKKQFDAAQKEMDTANAKLNPANSFKNATTPAEAAKIVNDTKNKIGYDDTKSKYEDASAKLASTLNGADKLANDPTLNVCTVKNDNGNEQKVGESARSVFNDLPKLGQSQAGSKAISDAVESEGDDKKTWLQNVSEYGEQAKGFMDNVRASVIESVGAKALSMAKNGDLNGSRNLFKGVSKLGNVFGASDEQMARFSTTLSALRQRQGPERLKAITSELGKQADEIGGDPKGKTAQALKGLGTVFGVANAYSGIKDFGKQDLQEKVNTVTSTIGTSKEVAEYLTGATSKFVGSFAPAIKDAAEVGGKALEKLGTALDPALQLVGAVSSAVDTYNDFKNGDVVAGVGDSLTTAGQLISGLTEAIPGVDLLGQGVGDALSVVGQGIKVIGSLFSSPPDPWAGTKDGIKQGFLDSGFSDDTASQLSELHGKNSNTFASYFEQVAKQTGQKPSDLLNSMKSWSSDQVRNFLDGARLSFDTDDGNDNRYNNAKSVIGQSLADKLENGDKSYLQTTGKDGQPVYNKDVVQGAAQWLYNQGLIPQPAIHPGAN